MSRPGTASKIENQEDVNALQGQIRCDGVSRVARGPERRRSRVRRGLYRQAQRRLNAWFRHFPRGLSNIPDGQPTFPNTRAALVLFLTDTIMEAEKIAKDRGNDAITMEDLINGVDDIKNKWLGLRRDEDDDVDNDNV